LKSNDDILIASSNKGKLKEFKKLFKNRKVFSLSDLNIEDAIEDGDSFLENAMIKAKHGAKESKLYTIADDSGIVVPKLGYEPGIYSARYAGEGASDKDNRDKIIDKMIEKKHESLEAFYVCVLVGLKSPNDQMPIVTQGEIHGRISINSSGEGGFGYDKIFYPDGYDCSMASLDQQIKNKVSHRAIASEKFIKLFNTSYDTFL
jgi:XTP/dITP diphosphohydrolase